MDWVGLGWVELGYVKKRRTAEETGEAGRGEKNDIRLVVSRTEVMPDGGFGTWWHDDGEVLAGKGPALSEARKSRVSMRISPSLKKVKLKWIELGCVGLGWVGLHSL